RGRAMMTNTPPNGAFRGFGAPQTQFAVEVHMDRIAERLGLDPVRVREINALRPGDTTATGQRLGKDCSALAVLREAVKRTDFKRKRRRLEREALERRSLGEGGSAERNTEPRRGIGLSLFFTKEYERPSAMSWDDTTYRGDAYGTYGWACDVVEMEVDADTCEAKPMAFTTVHEIGKAIHPALAIGQIEGGSAQGLGYALLEHVVMRDGRMANAQLTNYIIPTTLDTPK